MVYEQLKDWFKKHSTENMEIFFDYLRFPSISTDSTYKKDVLECADWLIDFCKSFGLESKLIDTPHYPIVFAEKHISEKYPTILIYGHYDVQPVDPLELWKSDPFEPKLENDNIFARGALDNKGQNFYVLLLLKALHELNISPQVNIKLCIEGEEESSSKGLSEILTDKKKISDLSCDYLLVVDADIPAKDKPAITLGARGIVPMDIELIGSDTDLHSGHHGGIIYSPIRALVEVLAKMWDENGAVAIDKFYEDVKEYSKEDLNELDLSFDKEEYKKSFGARALAPEGGRDILESNWLRPSIEINGIYGGYTKPGFKTVIPASANAKVSCRLVPDQSPEEVGEKISKFLSDNIPKGMEIKVNVMHGGKPISADPNSVIAKGAEKAYSKVFNKPCKKIMTGGSIPVIAELKDALDCEVVLMGMGLSDDNIHAPNEHFSWDRLERGFYVIGMLIDNFKSELS